MAPSLFHHHNSFSLHLLHPQMYDPVLSFSFFILFASLSLTLTLFSISIYKRFSKKQITEHPGPTRNPETNDPNTASYHSLLRVIDEVPRPGETSPVEVLPPDSAKWASLFADPDSVSSGLEGPGGESRGKKKKRKAKKKKTSSVGEESETGEGLESVNSGSGSGSGSGFQLCLYPFTSSSSTIQRKIKQHYDELVKCNESKKLTQTQVEQFANSLVNARSELQHKADTIRRKFEITKVLLCKADRSCFDRLSRQIYKLELEQKRLEEDAFVYNALQEQLNLSPAYQKILEIGACMEKEKSCELGKDRDDEFADISFEELLAQEKKDSFWQKNRKPRPCSS